MKLLVLTALLACTVAFGASIGSPQEAADYVVEQMLSDGYEGKTVLSFPAMLDQGQMISSWHEEVMVPFDAYLVLIDDMALANWEHPCRWVFVSSEGEMEVLRFHTPPTLLPRMETEYDGVDAPEPQSVDELRQQMLEWFEPNPQGNRAPENCYAWIISGGYNSGNNHVRYYGDTQFLYLTITQDYSYPEGNVIVCFADGTDPAPDNSDGQNSDPDLDGDGDDDFNYDATFSGVMSGYADIEAMVGPDDYLLIMTTDHGGSGKLGGNVPPEVYLNLWNTETWDDDSYDTIIDTFSSIATHVCMEQCYSGGFLEETIPTTGGQARTFASAANGSESSWAGATYPDYDEWIYWWIGAMHGSVPPGGSYPGGDLPYDPDTNGDGYVDYGEAWDAAYAWDSYAQSGQEHPQYDDDPDSCGSLYYLGGEIPSPGVTNFDLPVYGDRPLAVNPNPIAGMATAEFELSRGCAVELSVWDLTGRNIETITSGQLEAGSYSFIWDAEHSPAGIYLMTLRAEDQIYTVKVMKLGI